MLVLAMEIDQEIAETPELREKDRPAIDERAALTVSRELPSYDHAPLLGLDVEQSDRLEEVRSVREIEDALDEPPRLPGPEPFRIRALAQKERDRAQDQRFSGAGLSGEHVEGGIEGKLDPFHEGEPLDRKPGQHRSVREPCSGRRAGPGELLAQDLVEGLALQREHRDTRFRAADLHVVPRGGVARDLA